VLLLLCTSQCPDLVSSDAVVCELFCCDALRCVIHVWLQLVSAVLGHRCLALKDLRNESKAQIHALVPPAGAMERLLTIEGTVEQIQKAQYLVQKRSNSVLSALRILNPFSWWLLQCEPIKLTFDFATCNHFLVSHSFFVTWPDKILCSLNLCYMADLWNPIMH